MQTEEMRQAMNTLKAFSERERAYHAYQSRQDDLRQQRGLQRLLQDASNTTATAPGPACPSGTWP